MPTNEIHEQLIQQRGNAYRIDQIVAHSHYQDPIDRSAGRFAGHSPIWGDASPQVQSRVIDLLIDTSTQAGLDARQTAYVLAIARAESGFNPDAAAGTTSAYGIGQFVDRTGAAYGLNDSNRTDVSLQAKALVAHYQDNARLAQVRGQDDAYIYKYHHDGPSKDYGGLALSKANIMPYLARYEEFVRQRRQDMMRNPEGAAAQTKAPQAPFSGHTPSMPVEQRDGTGRSLRPLRVGMSGADVQDLQQTLNRFGFVDKNGRPLQEDGEFGRRTAEALHSFQTDYGLEPDAVAGPRVRAAWVRLEQIQQQPSRDPSEDMLLKVGGRGLAVKSVQESLNRVGYHDDNGLVLATHGLFNAQTAAAVRKLQREYGLQVDGIVGSDTVAALNQAAQKPLMNNPQHSDYHLFAQAQAGVHLLDRQYGRDPDSRSVRLAAALAVEAKAISLTRIDEVLVYRDGAVAAAVQNGSAGSRDRYAAVQISSALAQSLADSSEQIQCLQNAQPYTEPACVSAERSLGMR